MGCSASRSSVLLQTSPCKVASDGSEGPESLPRQPTLLRGSTNGALSGASLEDATPKLPTHKSAPAAIGKRGGGLGPTKKKRDSSSSVTKRTSARRVTFGEVQTRQFRVELYGLQMECEESERRI